MRARKDFLEGALDSETLLNRGILARRLNRYSSGEWQLINMENPARKDLLEGALTLGDDTMKAKRLSLTPEKLHT